ncbi:hypothetical protein [Massilia rhizosphaerae]|uniref:hypothetical protein n=1 Tax=Massilia rhizosphaerae TaxID=2784389 RepID=UPI0018DB0A78|nr:hypothetical protein [Massilia rhizosphaerae]
MSDLLKFPSGRSVGNCRKDAKRLARQDRIPLCEAQDRVAIANGGAHSWARALSTLDGHCIAPRHSRAIMTANDILAVMERWPTLNHFGFEVSARTEKPYHIALAENRERLKAAVDECNRAARFLMHAEKRKTINPRAGSSYGLKHQVEYFCRTLPSEHDSGDYVSNGSFICAALHLGFEVRATRLGGPNVHVNISSRSPIFEWRKLREQARGIYYDPKARLRLAVLEEKMAP